MAGLPPFLLPAPSTAAAGPVSPTPAVSCTIAGVSVTLLGMDGNPSISDAIGQRSTCKLVVRDDLGTARYAQGSAVYVYDNTGALIFGGIVQTDTIQKPSWGNLLLHSVACADWHYLADKRIVATSYANVTCGFMVNDLVTNFLASEGVTVGSIQTGPTLSGSIAFNYKTASYCLDKIATLAGFSWWIDASRQLWFIAPSTNLAPFTVDGSQVDDINHPLSLELTNPLYRNSQWIVGHKEVTTAQTETRKGDGTNRTFTMAYALHSVPSNIHVNAGAAQTIGINGVDTGKQWYWSKGSNQIVQDSSQTVLATTDTLSVTYVGEFAAVVYSQDGQQVAAQKTLEGAGSSGVVEDVQTDTALTTSAQAFQLAASLLAKYATSGEILKFTTKTPGLMKGQLLTVNLGTPWALSGQFLIESVTIRFDGLTQWWYDVSALAGPVNDTWVQFFTRLAAPASVVDDSSVGTSQSVALLQQFAAAWAWTAVLNATVTACALFPITFPKTLC